MVDIGSKDKTFREAVARVEVLMKPETLGLVKSGGVKKGDVLGVARVAGIMAAKETSRLIPMTHNIAINSIKIDFKYKDPDTLLIQASVSTLGRTGVEMEALTAVSVAALTVYDMAKSADKDIVVNNIRLAKKEGGKTGSYFREGEDSWV
ncbi:MAG: cyclic pyranopterin monophosphate synthase MoaC [Peptococcaceae bacterium]|nr:cyclic pyranopterin monophosphate synthase MoaC [Peptococcaceae bacterium]